MTIRRRDGTSTHEFEIYMEAGERTKRERSVDGKEDRRGKSETRETRRLTKRRRFEVDGLPCPFEEGVADGVDPANEVAAKGKNGWR